ncbi:MAG TPA: DinB family protein [Pseudonocardia sp.]|nr:DinB family protein [Pseudonocardia sp.]
MPPSRRDLLRWQFDLDWSLFELHLEQLEPADFGWEPADRCWTMHPGADGQWTPDWEVPEPEPVPVPTIGWLSWHIDWWWSVTLAHLQRRTPPERSEVRWPGPGEPVVRRLRGLRADWLAVLDGCTEADLDAPAPFPWPAEAGLTVAHTLAWVNAELMKNATEIGHVRMLRAAGGDERA